MKRDPETAVIPLIEEELHVGRREVERGRVRVRTVADVRTEHVSEQLMHSEAEVERVPINREISELPPIREEGDTLIVPVIEERLVKRLFLVEEVRLSRRVITETLEQPVQLRSQRVVVERDEGSGASIPNDRSSRRE